MNFRDLSHYTNARGFRLIGRDPYENNLWHLAKWLLSNNLSQELS